MRKAVAWVEAKGVGKGTVGYRLRDWLISRQRYWGTPIPAIHCEGCGVVPVPEEDLPVLLPEDVAFQGAEGNPLEKSEAFLRVDCPRCGKPARRETDTMDTFVDSSWYYLRFLDPGDDSRMLDSARAAHWMPVDQYVGGIEHAILHLLYARFICRVLKDMGLVAIEEPFARLFNQGMITKLNAATGKVEKMSKSRGNTVSPDELIERYGADTVRLYTLFIGPPEKESEWSEEGVVGAYRFLNRVHELCARVAERPGGRAGPRHAAGAPGASHDRRGSRRTPPASTSTRRSRRSWSSSGGSRRRWRRGKRRTPRSRSADADAPEAAPSDRAAPDRRVVGAVRTGGFLIETAWPAFDEELATTPRVTLVVQVNGKVRGRLDVERGTSRGGGADAGALRRAISSRGSREGSSPGSVFVPDRLLNLVVR